MSSNVSFDGKLEQRLRRTEVLTDEQLAMARKHQEESPIGLAEALIELDFLSSGEVEHIVGSMNEVRAVKLEELQVDLEAVKHIPRHIAMASHCIPIRRSGNSLVVAVSDGDTDRIREELRKVTDFEIVLLMAEHDALEHALFIYYGKDPDQSSGNQFAAGKAQIASNSWSIQAAWNQSFDTLIEHEGISRAKEVAKQIASGARESFNAPILFIGPSETGKSHLLTAIRNYCSAKEPLMHGILCTGAQLRNSIADYLIAGHLEALKYELRECSIVLIDDFADAWGSEKVEAEFASVIGYLRANGGTLIATMTDEQFLTGPSTHKLRELLEQGTEVLLNLPSNEALQRIVESKVNVHNQRKFGATPDWLKLDSRLWSDIRTQFLSRIE